MKIRMIAQVSHDNYDGHERSWVDWDLPDHSCAGVTSINTILDCLDITPKNGECFDLSIIPAAEAKEKTT